MKVNSETKIKKDGDNIIVTINEVQTKNKVEHEQDIQRKKSYLGQYQSELADIKGKLAELIDIEEDEETIKIAEMMIKAEKVKEKRALIEKMKFIEEQLDVLEKNIKEISV